MQSIVRLEEDQRSESRKNPLEDLLQEGARRLLQQAIGHEVDEYITAHEDDARASSQRNGYDVKMVTR